MFDLRAHTHLLTIAGSRAHGLHTDASDIDLKGMAIPPARYFHGVAHRFEQADDASQFDVFVEDLNADELAIAGRTGLEGSVYDLRKFVTLATSANPNVLESLFCRDEELRLATPLGEQLRDQRELFLSAKCVHTFAGYANQQLSRIRLHYRWHHHGKESAPTRSDFGLPEVALIPKSHYEAAAAAVQKQLDRWELDLSELDAAERVKVHDRIAITLTELRLASDDALWDAGARWVGLDDHLVEVMKRERRYQSARDEWRKYQGWKRNRNPDRAALEAEFGYDTKHGAHLVRLLRMGVEIAQTGQCIVWRGDIDGDELRAIRAGAWSYDALIEWSDAAMKQLRGLKTADFAVPERPDRAAIDALCVSLVEQALGC
ncbi:MAG: nucleotidyltransferase domain-containing protein [Proteobacteria bacterium]|nr:nucleotidyltransferase domain-containing protein [Pseudomonadota bacterium]